MTSSCMEERNCSKPPTQPTLKEKTETVREYLGDQNLQLDSHRIRVLYEAISALSSIGADVLCWLNSPNGDFSHNSGLIGRPPIEVITIDLQEVVKAAGRLKERVENEYLDLVE